MHVCMYACMHVCMYACMHVCMYACMHVCMYACMHVCMYACMHVCMHACMHACVMHERVCTGCGNVTVLDKHPKTSLNKRVYWKGRGVAQVSGRVKRDLYTWQMRPIHMTKALDS